MRHVRCLLWKISCGVNLVQWCCVNCAIMCQIVGWWTMIHKRNAWPSSQAKTAHTWSTKRRLGNDFNSNRKSMWKGVKPAFCCRLGSFLRRDCGYVYAHGLCFAAKQEGKGGSLTTSQVPWRHRYNVATVPPRGRNRVGSWTSVLHFFTCFLLGVKMVSQFTYSTRQTSVQCLHSNHVRIHAPLFQHELPAKCAPRHNFRSSFEEWQAPELHAQVLIFGIHWSWQSRAVQLYLSRL